MDNKSECPGFEQYYREIQQYPLLTREQEYALAKRYQGGDEAAGTQIIRSNLRFVVRVSRKYFRSGRDHFELIQEGNLGLIRALNKFDPERGVPFVYYAVWWIEAYIRTFLEKTGRANTGTLRHARNLISLDENLGPDGSSNASWIDFLAETTDPERLYFSKEASHRISALIQSCFLHLSKREVSVLRQRYFFDPPVGLKEIGSKLGVSKERVRQIQLRSMERIKKVMRNELGLRFHPFMFEDYPFQGPCREMLVGRKLDCN